MLYFNKFEKDTTFRTFFHETVFLFYSGPNSLSALYNGMIYPLLNYTIYGVMWYQGEANAILTNDPYNCTFPAMIEGWRREWYHSTSGSTDKQFPFGFVQVLRPDDIHGSKYERI